MGYKLFLDANVLLDFFLKREQYVSSRKLMQLLTEAKHKGFISSSIVHILGYWLTKTYGNAKAKQLIQSLLNDITVIDCPHATVEKALHSRIADIEDALQYYTAIEHKMDFFISMDKQLKKSAINSLPIYNLGDFLGLIK